MALSDIQDRTHVLGAIREFDQLGRDAFLAKYGFGKSRSYFLVHEGRFYDSKAIVGVAHQFTAPNQPPLQADEFSGGAATVQALLEKLGFTVMSAKPSHASYLLTWNPARWDWQTLDQDVQDIGANGSLIMRWSCGNTQSIKPGSRVFLLCQGQGPRGIIGSGTVVTGSYQAEHYDSERAAQGDMAWYVDVAYDALVNPFTSPYLPREVLDKPQFEGMHWNPAASGFRIPDAIATQLETTWADYAEAPFTYNLPDTALQLKEPPATYSEGQVKQVNTTRYERNPKARQQCLDHYGYRCQACGEQLDERYGAAAKDLIHVHHQTEISSIGEAYEVDPLKDLVPVCPNCHAVIHRKRPPYTVDEVKVMLRG